jgi:hypothetical protein
VLKSRPSFLFILFHSTRLCDELIFVAGSGGEDFGVLLLHLMFIDDLVLWHHYLVESSRLNVLMVFSCTALCGR